MKRLRKIFASLVMVTTVLTTVGAFAPSVSAAAQAGDLIKKDGLSAVYYLGEDGKRYVFPNEATYKSWYSDFSGVVTVSADELASYPLGANVVIRPGTKLVKITTDPKVYAVEPNGSLRWVQTEADAIALYGANWAQRVVDVADSFFTNYTIGQPLASNEVPVGSLVKKAGENSIYYYDGTNYRLIEDEVAFLANRFQNANVLTLSSFTAGGTTITGAEAAIVKTSQSGQSTGWKPGQGTGVTVALNSMTPASQSVPATVSRVPFTKVNFTASNDGATILEAITVKRSGLTENYTQFDRIWAEKDGVMVSSKRALNSNDEAILTFAPALNIPAGQTVTIDIIASLVSASGNGALGIASASAVTASGATVSGSFPIVGNLMSFTSYDVAKLTVAAVNNINSVNVGDEEVELANFDINFSTNPRDVVVNSITLRNTGSEDLASVFMGLYLENNGNVVSEKGVINGRYVTFNMKNGGLTMLKDDGNQSFAVKGDVIGKDNTTNPGVKFFLNKKEDLYAYEKATGFGVTLGHLDNLAIDEVTINAGAVSVSKKSTSPSDTTVVKSSKAVNVLIANLKADEAINADGLKVNVANYASSTVSSFENVKVYLNNILLGSFDPATTTSENVYALKTVDSSLSLKKGDNEVKVTVDVKSAAEAGDKIRVQLISGADLLDVPEYASNQNTVDPTDITGTATGAIITIEGGALSVTRNDGYADGRKAVKGTTDVSLAKFAVKALNDAVRLNSVSLAANSSAALTAIVDSSVYDMKLFVDGVQIGSTRNFSSGSTFSSLNLSIAKNTTKVIELKGSFDSSSTGTFKTVATFNAQDSLGKSITPALTATTADFEITEGGRLTVAKGANTPYSNILVAKTGVEQAVAEYRLTAVDDSANITELKLVNVNPISTTTTVTTADARIASYKLYDGSTLLDTAIPTAGIATFYISGNKLVVPANGSKTISVKAVFNSIEVAADTDAQLALIVKDGSVVAKSSNGSELAQANISGENLALSNHMVVRKTKPTFSKVNGIVGSASSAQEVARFKVAADANEDLRLTAIAFTVSNTGGAVISYSLYEVGNPNALATATDGDFSGFELVVNKGTDKTLRVTANTIPVGADKTFGLSLSNVAGTNKIAWGEYFVTGYEDYGSTYVEELPLDFGSMKY